MSWHRQHFETIAAALAAAKEAAIEVEQETGHIVTVGEALSGIEDALADYFAEQNEHFDRARWQRACQP